MTTNPTPPHGATVTLAVAEAVVRYATTCRPDIAPPENTDASFRVIVDLHRVPDDVFDAVINGHEDLPWKPVRMWHAGTPDQYRSVRVTLDHCELMLYSQRARYAPAAQAVAA